MRIYSINNAETLKEDSLRKEGRQAGRQAGRKKIRSLLQILHRNQIQCAGGYKTSYKLEEEMCNT